MPDDLNISNSQRYILTRIAQSVADDPDAQPHWATILLAATDDTAPTSVEERTGATEVLINQVLDKWKEAAEDLAKAEGDGITALQGAIEAIYEDYDEFEEECFCCCDCDEENELSMYELEMLAGKVYNLLRRELVIERERMGYAHFSRN